MSALWRSSEKRAAIVRISGSVQDMPALMDRAFSVTSRAITSAGARYAGHPFARYTAFGEHIEAAVSFPFVGDVLRPRGSRSRSFREGGGDGPAHRPIRRDRVGLGARRGIDEGTWPDAQRSRIGSAT